MHQAVVTQRWRHPAFLVYLLGGILGSVVNLTGTLLLVWKFSCADPLAFGIGAFLNQAFHYFFYKVVYVNQEIRLKTSFPLHLFLSICVSAASAVLLWGVLGLFHWSLLGSLFFCLILLSGSNTLLNRISTFSSASLAEVEYREMNESYYEDHTDETKVSRFRAWYHRSRYERLTQFVARHFKKGMKIADLGCGNCLWNIRYLPVFGIDINGAMLRWAKRNGRLKDYKVCANLAKTGLKTKSLDLILMSEVLEHVFNLREVLAEVRRILKNDGTFLITVPYDFFLGPFFILFNLNCLYMGYLRGSEYHKYRCGHIHHYTQNRLRETLDENGFELKKIFVVNSLLLYAEAKKKGF